mmetsp:Transcript_51062/g.155279  ORF Transcript_51062/g.155279 Transcript_51062/m.155279 type:complete len:222 (-) Transcript_51062:758-1423(-)
MPNRIPIKHMMLRGAPPSARCTSKFQAPRSLPRIQRAKIGVSTCQCPTPKGGDAHGNSLPQKPHILSAERGWGRAVSARPARDRVLRGEGLLPRGGGRARGAPAIKVAPDALEGVEGDLARVACHVAGPMPAGLLGEEKSQLVHAPHADGVQAKGQELVLPERMALVISRMGGVHGIRQDAFASFGKVRVRYNRLPRQDLDRAMEPEPAVVEVNCACGLGG